MISNSPTLTNMGILKIISCFIPTLQPWCSVHLQRVLTSYYAKMNFYPILVSPRLHWSSEPQQPYHIFARFSFAFQVRGPTWIVTQVHYLLVQNNQQPVDFVFEWNIYAKVESNDKLNCFWNTYSSSHLVKPPICRHHQITFRWPRSCKEIK